MSVITSHVMTSWSEIKTLQTDWNPLLEQSDADNIFLTWEWMESWKDTCFADTKLLFIVLKENNKPIAIAPFYIQPYQLLKTLTYQVLRFAGDQGIGSEYSNFIVRKQDSVNLKQQLWQTLLAKQTSSHWDLIWYTNVSSWTTGGQSLITSLQQTPELRLASREVDFANTSLKSLSLSLLPELSKSLRTNIKQTQGYLSKLGEWQVSYCEDPVLLNKSLQQLFELHNLRWQRTGLKGSFQRRPEMATFYQDFTRKALHKGWLRLAELTCDDKTQAVQIGYVYRGQFFALQEGFNPDFQKGTGQVLRYHVMQRCIQEGLTDYDFLGQYTNHKRRWLAKQRNGQHLLIWPNKLKNTLFNFFTIWPTGKYLKPVRLNK
ncbi:GNAT family N-acetyltransferase [Psychromonas sp. B3M02]|uniref:GNAT family N-acetyltransferase n=1 Tax=Psychromonas sp. B3M02 TaxID=2267226 RepID=UPI0015F0BB24|nr:GNAT family N-acetyltransferase [Psychromonas sp. B3M02]